MALILNAQQLRSKIVRKQLRAKELLRRAGTIVGGKTILGKLARFVGWGFSALMRFFNISFDSIWDTIIQGYFQLKSFDWNATDKELQKQVEANNKNIVNAAASGLGEQLGIGTVRLVNGFVGRFLGGLGSNRAKAAVAAEGIKIPVLSSRIGAALAEEQNTELANSVRYFLLTAAGSIASNAFISFVLTARRNEWLGQKSITTPQIDGSIAAKIERKIEKIPEFWREPVQNLISGFESGVFQAGYVISRNFDDAYSEALYARQNQGDYTTIEILPDGESRDQQRREAAQGNPPLVLTGKPGDIVESVPTALALYPLVNQPDVAAPPMTWALKPGADRPQLTVTYRSADKRQYHSFHIPHYTGGNPPRLPSFKTGHWHGFWVLNDGSKLALYAASRQEALRTLGRWGRFVNPKYRKGTRPEAKETSRVIKRQDLTPYKADFYPRGASNPVSWRAYL